MFDIVVDYPDSRPAVQDVKDCLAHTNLHRKFVAGFKQAIAERLLHAGTTSTHACMPLGPTCTSMPCMNSTSDTLSSVAGVCPYVCMSACLPVCLSVCVSVCLSVCLSVCVCLSGRAAVQCNSSKGALCDAGAATSDIIEQYVSTIKTLREVDPTGRLSCMCCYSMPFLTIGLHAYHHPRAVVIVT